MTRDDPFDLVGDVLDGQFRVDAFVDEGDLSVIYKGHHVVIDAPVAIKCLNLPETLDLALVGPLVESFREASRVHYRLARGSLHIAQSLGAGQTMAPRTGATILYTVREWFEGESLAADLLRRRNAGKKGRTVDETMALLEPAIEGIAYAHGKGLPHLSVNPGNFFIAKNDGGQSLKVLDFGVARTINELRSELSTDVRKSGGLRLLFPAYAAPEQLDRTVGETGPWTDVYAIALVFMELLSDRVVMHDRETGVIVSRALDEEHRPTPAAHGLRVSRGVELALTRAVARAPAKRQKDADTLWRELKSAQRGTVSRSISPKAPTLPPPRAALPTLVGVAPPPVVPEGVYRTLRDPARPRVPTIPVPQDRTQPVAHAPPSVEPAVVEVPQVQIVTAKLPPPMPPSAPAEMPFVPAFPFGAPPPPMSFGVWGRPSASLGMRALVAAGAGLVVVLLITVVILVVGSGSKRAPATAAASPGASVVPAASVGNAVASVGVPVVAPAATSTSAARFSAFAATRAFYGASRDVATCKRGPRWGTAYATVTFANDGSVDQVVIGPPFAGTPTGECVSDKLKALHVPPFGGQPSVQVTRFFVARQ